ncbi:oligomeric complex COG6 [Aureobasidium pullulans]|uniref:Conserved oligomeric Golgi complex subunit 6 n=1 Tax=Aureobasidium pullulans TaxID=5580 RepID=A0AB74J2D6_AURPU|nr:oligomeric complex COG6 [Aureobasidium pullulans]
MATGYFPERLKDATLPPSPAMSPGPTAQRSSALQSRITSVLAASYSDLEIRDALETLDARQVHNTAETRRNLRLDAQQELIQCNGEIIRDFGQVAQQLQRVGAAIEDLNKLCSNMRSHISAANRETGPMLEESTAMMAQRQQTETKQQLLGAFTSHFLLSDAEITSLTSTAEPVTDAFFQALTRVKQIHDDSQLLLGTEDQQLGLEILEQSSKQLNAAFQKLFRWTQRELRTLDLENPQLSISVRRALRVLAERPALFQSCLDFFAENREQVLSDAFYAALTGGFAQRIGGPASGKAIELSAHDPLRYVSDMLAWAHAATVGEREALQILFISDADEISRNIKAGREREPWLQITDGTDGEEVAAFDGKKALNDLVDRDLSGVLRQLRQRVEQTIQSHEDATLAYQISNLIRFYCSIFVPLLGPESTIIQTLQPITQKAFEQFRTLMRDHIANIHSDVSVTPLDLSPPDFLLEALETLKGLMKSYDTSLANASSGEDRTGFQAVLEEALDPYLAGCDSISKGMGAPQSQILAINCLLATKETLKGRAFTANRLDQVDEAAEDQAERLVHTVHAWFVLESGLKRLFDGLKEYKDTNLGQGIAGIRKLREMQPDRLADMAQKLDAFLPGAMEDARAFVGKLADKRMVREVCDKAADLFVEEFESAERIVIGLDETILAEQGEELEEGMLLRDVFPRTSDEIKVLLS